MTSILSPPPFSVAGITLSNVVTAAVSLMSRPGKPSVGSCVLFTNIFTYFKYIYLFVIIFCVQFSFDIFAIGSVIPSKVNNKVLRKRDLKG